MINGPRIAKHLARVIPGRETVTLTKRNSDDTTTSYTIPNVRRKPLTASDMVLAGANLGETWVSYATEQIPAVGWKVTGADGVVFEVRNVTSKLVNSVHTAYCLKDK